MNSLLETDLVGRIIDNPFLVAPCPATRSAEQIVRAAKAGWAGAVTKTVTSTPPYDRNPAPFLTSMRAGKNIVGLFNNESYTEPPLATWCEYIIPSILRAAPSNFLLVGSLMEGRYGKVWAKSAGKLASAGVHLIEMNVSCPHGAPSKHMGKYVGDDPELLYNIVKECASSVQIPIFVKSADSADLINAALACESAGAAGLTTTNTLSALPRYRS